MRPHDKRQAVSYQILMPNLMENSPNPSQGAVSVAADPTVESEGNRPGGWELGGIFTVLTDESSGEYAEEQPTKRNERIAYHLGRRNFPGHGRAAGPENE